MRKPLVLRGNYIHIAKKTYIHDQHHRSRQEGSAGAPPTLQAEESGPLCVPPHKGGGDVNGKRADLLPHVLVWRL